MPFIAGSAVDQVDAALAAFAVSAAVSASSWSLTALIAAAAAATSGFSRQLVGDGLQLGDGGSVETVDSVGEVLHCGHDLLQLAFAKTKEHCGFFHLYPPGGSPPGGTWRREGALRRRVITW
jgi:hypothetical protein